MLVTQSALHTSSDLWAIIFATEIQDIFTVDRNPGTTLMSTSTSHLIYHKNLLRLIEENLHLFLNCSSLENFVHYKIPIIICCLRRFRVSCTQQEYRVLF